MGDKNRYGLAPFVLITFIYFIVGFLTTVNGQLQGPLQVAFLSEVIALRNTLITLIPFFFFLGYLLNSSFGARWINSFGYKKTVVRALIIMTVGLIFYFMSSYIATYFRDFGINIKGDYIPFGFLIFLLGSFFMGTSAAILQVAINPYVASYNLPNTQPVQRMSIVCAINSLGTTIAPFFVTGVIFAGVSVVSVESAQLLAPFAIMTIFIAIIATITYRLNIPNIEGTFNSTKKRQERSIWSFRHLRLGVLAIFFYVGAEVAIGVNVNLHAIELITNGDKLSFFGFENIELWGANLGVPALLATLYWGGLMVGRTLSSFLKSISAKRQLVAMALLAIVLTTIAILTNNLWVLISVGLCHSIMWGAIFTLAVDGLGEYTSRASALFMKGVFGGALFPLLQGYLADSFGSWQYTWALVIICELVILYYALYGSKVRERDIIKN